MSATEIEVEPTVFVPKPNPRNNVNMFKIFQNVQYNVAQHKKYVKEMKKLYEQLEEEAFCESFKNALMYLFTFGDTSANVDRVIQFVATFSTSLDDEGFLMYIFEQIFECQSVSGWAVRYRSTQLLAAVLLALGEDACLDAELCKKLRDTQFQRLQDTRGAVRCRAVLALQRLQSSPECEVTTAYRFHMSCDPNSSVRRAVVMSITICKPNIPFVLERLCDVDVSVRRAAFLYVASIPVTYFKVTQRIRILTAGLTQENPRVRSVVEEIIIPDWLGHFQGNVIDLLKAIRLDNIGNAKDSQFAARKLLETLFKSVHISQMLEWLPIDENLRLIPYEKLNKEYTWYWRHLIEHLLKINDEDSLVSVLPDLVVMVGYIRAIVESPCPDRIEDPAGFTTRQHVLLELTSILHVYDVSDPAGRIALKSLITHVLASDCGHLDSEVIQAFVFALTMVVPEVNQRMEVVAEVINSLRDPPAPERPPSLVEDAQTKLEVEDLQRKLDGLSLQPSVAPTIKEKISDSETLNKCLVILNSALDTPDLKKLTPLLWTIFRDLEEEIYTNPSVLENALKTVAVYGMLDKKFAVGNKDFFFLNLLDMTDESVVCIVLKGIVDLFCVHGVRLFEDEEMDDDAPEHNAVLVLLLKILDETCAAYRLIIGAGLCRLLHLGHLESPSILSRLLLLWFNPATGNGVHRVQLQAEEDMLRQVIGVFFQILPTSVDRAQELIQKATLPTLRALANAPLGSPLVEINQEEVVRFIVSLTKVTHESVDSAADMAMSLASSLSRCPSMAEAGLVCRMLALLSPPRDPRLAADIAATLEETSSKLHDRQSKKNVARYIAALTASLKKTAHAGVTDATLQTADTSKLAGAANSTLLLRLSSDDSEDDSPVRTAKVSKVPRLSSDDSEDDLPVRIAKVSKGKKRRSLSEDNALLKSRITVQKKLKRQQNIDKVPTAKSPVRTRSPSALVDSGTGKQRRSLSEDNALPKTEEIVVNVEKKLKQQQNIDKVPSAKSPVRTRSRRALFNSGTGKQRRSLSEDNALSKTEEIVVNVEKKLKKQQNINKVPSAKSPVRTRSRRALLDSGTAQKDNSPPKVAINPVTRATVGKSKETLAKSKETVTNSRRAKKPYSSVESGGTDLENQADTRAQKDNFPPKVAKNPLSLSNATVGKSKETVSKSKDTVVKSKDTVGKSKDSVGNSKDTVGKSKDIVGKSKETVVKSRQAVKPKNTESHSSKQDNEVDPVAQKDNSPLKVAKNPVTKATVGKSKETLAKSKEPVTNSRRAKKPYSSIESGGSDLENQADTGAQKDNSPPKVSKKPVTRATVGKSKETLAKSKEPVTNSRRAKKPYSSIESGGSDLENQADTGAQKDNSPPKVAKNPLSLSNDTVGKSKETVSKSKDTVVKSKDTVGKSQDSVGNSKDTVGKSKDIVGKSKETVVKSRQAVKPKNTESHSSKQDNEVDPVAQKDNSPLKVAKNPVTKATVGKSKETLAKSKEPVTNSRRAKKPYSSIESGGSDLENQADTGAQKDNSPPKVAKNPLSLSNDTVGKSKETVSKSKDTVVKSKDTVGKSQDSVGNSKDTVSISKDIVGKSKETVVKSRQAVKPKNTESHSSKQDNEVDPVAQKDNSPPKVAKNPVTRATVGKSKETLAKSKEPVTNSRRAKKPYSSIESGSSDLENQADTGAQKDNSPPKVAKNPVTRATVGKSKETLAKSKEPVTNSRRAKKPYSSIESGGSDLENQADNGAQKDNSPPKVAKNPVTKATLAKSKVTNSRRAKKPYSNIESGGSDLENQADTGVQKDNSPPKVAKNTVTRATLGKSKETLAKSKEPVTNSRRAKKPYSSIESGGSDLENQADTGEETKRRQKTRTKKTQEAAVSYPQVSSIEPEKKTGRGKKAEPKVKTKTGKKNKTGGRPKPSLDSCVDSPHFMTDESDVSLHTIIYDDDAGFQQSLLVLNDSVELQDGKPNSNDTSESEPDLQPTKPLGKKGGKGKIGKKK